MIRVLAPAGRHRSDLLSVVLMVGLVGATLGLGYAANDPELLVLYLAGLGGLVLAVVTLLAPATGAATMPFLLFTGLVDIYGQRDGLVTTFQLAIALFLVAALTQRLIARRIRLVFDRVLVWMLVFAAAIVLSALGALDRSETLFQLGVFAREIVILFVLINLVDSAGRLEAASWALVAAGALLAAVPLYALVGGAGLAGLTQVETGHIAGSLEGSRIAGALADSNEFARLLLIAVPLALYGALSQRRADLVRMAALAALALMTLTIVLTFSRGALLGLLAVAVGALLLGRSRPAHLLVIGLAVATVAFAAPQSYWDRANAMIEFLGGEDTSLSHSDMSLYKRSAYLQIGGLVFLDHPLTGVGRGNYLTQYDAYAWRVDPSLLDQPGDVHSLPVHIAAETGLVGLLGLGGSLVAAVLGAREARRRFASAGMDQQALLAGALELSLYGYFIASLFLNYTYTRYFWMLIAMAIVARQVALRTAAPAASSAAGEPTHAAALA